jgi:hypothetical protein
VCDGLQSPIADVMAIAVIDRFEVINVKHHERKGILWLSSANGLMQAFKESAPVVEASQRIRLSEPDQFRLHERQPLGGTQSGM